MHPFLIVFRELINLPPLLYFYLSEINLTLVFHLCTCTTDIPTYKCLELLKQRRRYRDYRKVRISVKGAHAYDSDSGGNATFQTRGPVHEIGMYNQPVDKRDVKHHACWVNRFVCVARVRSQEWHEIG